MTRTALFPMTYNVHGRLPGRVMPRSYIFAEMVELQVTDVAREDAPIAVSWKVPYIRAHITSAEYRPMWLFDAEQQQHTVFHEGRHWVRLLRETPYENSPSEPLQSADFERDAATGAFNKCLGFAVPTQGQRKFEVVTEDPGNRFDEIIRHGRAKALDLASGLDFISVDGVLHARCDQPCFKLVPAWYEVERSAAITSDGPARIKTRYPVVDTKELREPITLDPLRVPALPLSMRDDVARKCPKMGKDIDQFEWPTVHIPESLSADDDLRLEADYRVHEFLAWTENTLGSRWALLEQYFRKPTVEAKLDYLLASAREWPQFESRYGVSMAPLRQAVEALDNRSISIAPGQTLAAPLRP
ncbi:hypothetical protein HFO56_01775 [Rhizobium laguerreae]|uniref:hypothetical protein n=1 Tax=Rhizobium laguerreae TaxID=1076926 RepID=UPI001C8FB830|nr:hypothetical protein [Rhizobium laguerreae]MBY3151135.1 hypothetical protein [Rhizobium laguerreae]